MWNKLAGCKEIAELDAVKEHVIHRKKLLKIKPRIDNRPPKSMPHVKYKAKKELEELKVQAEIQYQNQLLLTKLQKIELNSRSHTSQKSQSGFGNRLRLEEMMRIGDENQKILNRIQSTKPHYSARKHELDYLTSKYLSLQLSENARRIPRHNSYNNLEMYESAGMMQATKSSRPGTAATSNRGQIKLARPMSAKQIKVNL